MITLRPLVSAALEFSAEPPSWPFPLPVDDVFLPVPCAAPPGSFSFAHDVSEAAHNDSAQRTKQRSG